MSGEFGKEGEAGSNITYRADVKSDATPAQIAQLMQDVDKIAEIHNTLRQGVKVTRVN